MRKQKTIEIRTSVYDKLVELAAKEKKPIVAIIDKAVSEFVEKEHARLKPLMKR